MGVAAPLAAASLQGMEEGASGGGDSASVIPGFGATLQARLAEAGSYFQEVRGTKSLARYLAAQARGALCLEEHPWLRQAAGELQKLGVKAAFGGESWAPEGDTAVTVAQGAVAETGSVITPGGAGPATWLPFRARRQVVLVPPDKAGLTLLQALELAGAAETGLTTWLTGPSRTTDIEKVLVLGAQGPEQLDIIIYHPGD